MEELIKNPLFGIILSIGAFEIGKLINKKTGLAILNPLLLAIIMLIGLLKKFDIPFEDYSIGGNIVLFFLGPATVVLAIPLYKQRELFKRYLIPILLGISVGTITAVSSVIVLSKLAGLNIKLLLSFVPKSITTPIGIEVSRTLGGEPSITIMGILITGITGFIGAPWICRVCNINNSVARGIGIGAASHAIGTTKAIEMGEVEGAMSGLAIGVTGIITLILAPIIVKVML